MNSITLINILNCFFIIIILYNIIYDSCSTIEGLTANQQKIENKINQLEKDIKSVEKVNPLMPCAPMIPIIKNNTNQIKSMMDSVTDLKANCARQNA